jgi:hypothetical protein
MAQANEPVMARGATARGTQLVLSTTAPGTNTLTTRLALGAPAREVCRSAPQAQPIPPMVTGDLNIAGRLLINGAAVSGGSGLTLPSAGLINSNGTTVGAVAVGSGLGLTGTYPNQTLTASGTTLTVPNANILTGNGALLGGITVGSGLSLTGPFPNQNLTATGGGGIANITFASPLTGGTISTSGQTVGLTMPTAQLLGGTGSAFTGVSVGSGLNLSGGILTATGAALTIPNANIVSGNGATLGGITLGTGLGFTGTFPNQTLNATGASLTIPTANLLGGTGAALTGVSVGTGLLLSGGISTARQRCRLATNRRHDYGNLAGQCDRPARRNAAGVALVLSRRSGVGNTSENAAMVVDAIAGVPGMICAGPMAPGRPDRQQRRDRQHRVSRLGGEAYSPLGNARILVTAIQPAGFNDSAQGTKLDSRPHPSTRRPL